MKNLTAKQEKFCQEVASGKSQSEAYRIAYNAENMSNEVVWSKASELMSNGKVAVRVEEIRKPAVENARFTLENHLNNLLLLRDKAAENNLFSAAVSAEIARGKASGFYTTKLNVEEPEKIIVNLVRCGDDDEMEIIEENIHGK